MIMIIVMIIMIKVIIIIMIIIIITSRPPVHSTGLYSKCYSMMCRRFRGIE